MEKPLEHRCIETCAVWPFFVKMSLFSKQIADPGTFMAEALSCQRLLGQVPKPSPVLVYCFDSSTSIFRSCFGQPQKMPVAKHRIAAVNI